MNCVIYFSCTGNCKKAAERIAAKTQFAIKELTKDGYGDVTLSVYGTAVIVFPVHCQSYPEFLKKLFKNIRAESVALVALYGGAHAGNALYEAAKLIKPKIIAAAYIPAGHSYTQEEAAPSAIPDEFIEKLGNSAPVKIIKRKKTPFAGVFPSLRSRTIIKIYKSEKCVGCNECGKACPYGAIERGRTNARCARCLKCVAACPHTALTFKKSRVLSRYLENNRFNETILYIK